jgi:hypothetical protein
VLEPQEAIPEKELVPGVTLAAVTGLVYQAPVGEEATCGGGRATEVMVGLEASYWKLALEAMTLLPALSVQVPVTLAALEFPPE